MLEKEITTPEQYPLSLNGLTNACNQKSNREPVLNLSESEVQNVLDELAAMNLVNDQGAFGGRVAKYQHRFCNTEFGNLQFSPQQRAIICVMLLRGPQTPGELRTRTNRLAEFSNVSEVETALDDLQSLDGTSYVVKLAREPGKRESRYGHLFSGDFEDGQDNQVDCNAHDMQSLNPESRCTNTPAGSCMHCDALASRVDILEQELNMLKTKLNDLL